MKQTLIFIIILKLCSVTFANETNRQLLQLHSNLKTSFYELSFDINFPNPVFKSVKTSDGEYLKISLKGCHQSVSTGDPDLPLWNQLIEIPKGATWNISFSDIIFKEIEIPEKYKGLQILPVQPPRAKSQKKENKFYKNNNIYNSNQWFSNDFIQIDDIGIMRNARIGRLTISPIMYQPAQEKLRIVKSAKVEISFQLNNDPVEWKTPFTSPFFNTSSYTLNGSVFSIPPIPENFPVHYVILSDSMFYSTLQPFIEWKRLKGFMVTEVYKGSPGVGLTANSMRAYLQNIYLSSTSADPAPTYLLIVGDTDQIPPFQGTTSNHVTDLYYAEYTGDIFPELYYGRFSASTTAQLENQIEKTLHVEKYLMTDPSYLQRGILIAGHDAAHATKWGNGHMIYAQNNYINQNNNMVPSTYLHPASSSQGAQIIQDIEAGASLVNYSAHGSQNGWISPAFNKNHVATLSNNGRYPTIISNACETNKFDEPECFGEALLRAENSGAVGHIGASNQTFWDEDLYFAVGYGPIIMQPTYQLTDLGFYDRLFHTNGEPPTEWAISQGAIIKAGNMAVTQSGSMVNKYWEIYHLMGDPSLMPYLGVPANITPLFPPSLPVNVPHIAIQTLPYDYVAVSANGVLHGSGMADGNGVLNLQIQPFNQPTNAVIVVTGQNRAPFVDTIEFITASGSFVLADSISFREVIGNHNNQIDAGETIEVDLKILNYTSIQSSALTARIVLKNQYITLIDSIVNIPALGGNDSIFITGAFQFIIDDFVPNGLLVSGNISITDTLSQTWTTPFSLIINSPKIKVTNVIISDAPGNNNGIIEPGEDIEIVLTVKNQGSTSIQSVDVSIDQNSPYINLDAFSATIPVFDAGNSYSLSFSGTAINQNIPKGKIVKVNIVASKTPYYDSAVFLRMLGEFREDFSSNSFNDLPWVLTGSQHWFTTNEDPYIGDYCARSGNIPNQSSTSMEIELPVIENDSIRFVYKVSSEEHFDVLKFSIDNIERGRWSGEHQTWTHVVFPVDSGLRTFKWSYEKDHHWEEGQDCAWVDYIIFPPTSIYSSTKDISTANFKLNIYPNPSRGNLTVSISSDIIEEKRVSLIGTDGRVLVSKHLSDYEHEVNFDIRQFKNGLYLILIETPSATQTRKIVKF